MIPQINEASEEIRKIHSLSVHLLGLPGFLSHAHPKADQERFGHSHNEKTSAQHGNKSIATSRVHIHMPNEPLLWPNVSFQDHTLVPGFEQTWACQISGSLSTASWFYTLYCTIQLHTETHARVIQQRDQMSQWPIAAIESILKRHVWFGNQNIGVFQTFSLCGLWPRVATETV